MKDSGPFGAAMLAVALCLGAAAVHAQLRAPGGLVCSRGTRPCVGAFGAQCYTPTAGTSCAAGIVCGAGQQVCAGVYGAGCFQPSAGQQCASGLVCEAGQLVCGSGGYARCFSPSAGETCN